MWKMQNTSNAAAPQQSDGIHGLPAAGTWGRVSKAAALDAKLSDAAFRVLSILGCYADAQGYCYPAVGTVAAQLRLTRRSVQRHLRRLERLGYLTTLRQYRIKGGGWSVNAYMLKYPPAPSLARVPDAHEAAEGGDPSAAHPKRTGGPENANGHDATSHVASPLDSPESFRNSGDRCDTPCRTDATPGVAPDATPGVVLTIPLNYPTENYPTGARVRARENGVIVYQDGSWEPDPETPSPGPADAVVKIFDKLFAEYAPKKVAYQDERPLEAPKPPATIEPETTESKQARDARMEGLMVGLRSELSSSPGPQPRRLARESRRKRSAAPRLPPPTP